MADHVPPASFYEEMRKHCRCCACSNPPCAGVCAGGMCDETCFCSFDGDFDEDDDG